MEMTMTKRFVHLFCAAIVIMAAISCDKHEAERDTFEENGVAETIKNDFYKRYPQGVKVTKAFTYGVTGDYVDNTSYVEFIDTDGMKCTAIYKDLTWLMTQKEYDKERLAFLEQLPQNIARAYIRSGIDNEFYENDNSYVIEVSRRGFDKKAYEFRFLVPQKDETYSIVYQEYTVLIDEDGNILDIMRFFTNRSFWAFDMRECVDFVRGKYPKAVILAGVSDAGDSVLYINDGGIQKTVRFDNVGSNEQIWEETVYRLADDVQLPETVAIEYADYKTEHPDFIYSEVYHVERKDGVYYGLKMYFGNKNSASTTVFFKV